MAMKETLVAAMLDALKEAQARYHEKAEDHWSYQCSELSPCVYCEAIAALKETIVVDESGEKRFPRTIDFLTAPANYKPMNREQAQGRIKRSTLTIGQAERALREDFDPTCVLCEFGEKHEH